MNPETKATIALFVAAVISAIALAVWFHFMRRKRLVQDLPTSKTAGVALGLTELIGTVECDEPVVSPHGATDCAFWKQVVYEERRTNNGVEWVQVEDRTGGRQHFDLVDDTGSIRVWTRDAEVELELEYHGPLDRKVSLDDGVLAVAIAARGGAMRRKVKEYILPIGATTYVLGTSFLRDDAVRPEIGPDPDGKQPFLVNIGDEDSVVHSQRLVAWVGAVVAVLAAAAAGVFWTDGAALLADEPMPVSQISVGQPLALAGLALWVMLFASMVFQHNALVRLHHRAERAWSLLAVELRRRHDLIPQLVDLVTAHRDIERSIQTELAELRSSSVELPEDPSDEAVHEADPAMTVETKRVRSLLFLAEAYPELGAHGSFAALQRQITLTEDRIALARSFYNDSVQRLHDRAQGFPGAPLAWLFELDLNATFDVDRPAPIVAEEAPASNAA